MKKLLSKPSGLLGVAIIACLVLAVTFAPLLAPFDPNQSSVFFLAPPDSVYLLGTDDLGRDTFSRLLYGGRSSLIVGIGASAVALLIGLPVGLAAGYLGGKVDLVARQFIDLFVALPGLVLALIIAAIMGPTLTNLTLVLGFVNWPRVARLARGQALAIRESVFVEAARAIGAGTAWIIRVHIWRNIIKIIAAQFALTVAYSIFTSASLSFLGLAAADAGLGRHGAGRLRLSRDQPRDEPRTERCRGPDGLRLLPHRDQHRMNPERAEMPLISVSGLEIVFRAGNSQVRAVRDVSLTIEPGEVVALVGESGSGKSTTGLALLGLHPLRQASIQGEVLIRRKDGTILDVVAASEKQLRRIRGNDIAMIFQEPMSSLNPVHRIGEQIVEAQRAHNRLPHSQAWTRALDMLTRLGVPSPEKCMASYAHELSGGMRQRVMIAMALSCGPALLIADEPTTALDVTIQAQIVDILKVLQRETRMAMLFVSHDLGLVSQVATRVLVMYGGQIVEEGPLPKVFLEPRMPYTRALMRSRAELGAGQRRIEPIPGNVPSLAKLPDGCTFHPRCPHSVPGLCDVTAPGLELVPDGRVRCHRWRELEASAA